MAHILIIDDEQPIRTSLREILEYEGARGKRGTRRNGGRDEATKGKV